MKSFVKIFLPIILGISFLTAYALPAPIPGAAMVPSQNSFAVTYNKLTKLLKEHDYQIIGTQDHQAIAAKQGYKILPNVALMIDNPKFDYLLTAANPQASLFLPIMVMVAEDEQKQTYISYWDPMTEFVPLLKITDPEVISEAKKTSEMLKMVAEKAGK